MINKNEINICVIGLGYVGLPIALEFSKKYSVVGFDIDEKRVVELKKGVDRTCEVSSTEFENAEGLVFTSDADNISFANIYIVTVPTPIDKFKQPDLRPLIAANALLCKVLAKGDIVIFESTVFPGATEEICVPILENNSELKFNVDFFVGYSPERINPGDKSKKLVDIVKITSGSTVETAQFVDKLYSSIILAGTFRANSIKVAEAAKVIENTQRDVNIALVNELAIIFDRLQIDTLEVLEAAGTKWNFLPFRPGLVGGHCIGVDPYYLCYKSEELGYSPEVILSGRRVNDSMGKIVATHLIKGMLQKDIQLHKSNVLILGFTFKENCPDIRNTKVVDIVNELADYKLKVSIYDPWCNQLEVKEEFGLSTVDEPRQGAYDAIVLAVAHDKFKEIGIDKIQTFGKPKHLIYDLKGLFEKSKVDLRL